MLSAEEIEQFLAQPLLGTLATYRASGQVLLSPVWQEWREGGFTVIVTADDVKVRHARRRPEGSLVVAEPVPPYRGVEARGRFVVHAAGYAAAQQRMAARYLARIAPYQGDVPPSLAASGLLLRLEPEYLRSWSFGFMFPEMSDRTSQGT